MQCMVKFCQGTLQNPSLYTHAADSAAHADDSVGQDANIDGAAADAVRTSSAVSGVAIADVLTAIQHHATHPRATTDADELFITAIFDSGKSVDPRALADVMAVSLPTEDAVLNALDHIESVAGAYQPFTPRATGKCNWA